MKRAAAVAFSLLALAGCRNKSPSGPTDTPTAPDILALPLGLYRLQLTGSALSPNPDVQTCVPILVPKGGTMVITNVTLRKEGTDYVGEGVDSLTVRLRGTGERFAGNPIVSGEVTGSANDIGFGGLIPPRGVRITLTGSSGSGAAQLTGRREESFTFLHGSISGRMTFADTAGEASTCGTVDWIMQQ